MKKSSSSLTFTEARRLAIVESALTCFLKHGYAKTSLDDISKAASLSRPLLYLAFSNKEDIFRAVFQHVIGDGYAIAEEIMSAPITDMNATIVAIYDALLIKPYKKVIGAPMVMEFYETCSRLLPDSAVKHEKLLRKYMNSIFGDKTTAEVFTLAVVGMWQDVPTASVLESRVGVLVDHFVRGAESRHAPTRPGTSYLSDIAVQSPHASVARGKSSERQKSS